MTALAAIGSIASGVLGFMQADYQSQVAKMNAHIAAENAQRASERSQIEQEDQDAKSAAMIGELVASQSASGIALGSGSSMLTRTSAAKLGRQDALRVRQAGATEAYNYLTQAENFNAQAKADSMGGIGSLLGGFLGGARSLIGDSSAVNKRYAQRFY